MNKIWSLTSDVREYIIVPLKRYEKTALHLYLEKYFGVKDRSIYDDIEQTYNETISKHGRRYNIKIKTNLIPPQKYKFVSEEVEIIT